MSYYTYVVKCSDGSLYTGYTNDLEKRVSAHNEGKGARYTRSRRPVELVYYEEYPTKEEAMSREWHIKQLTKAEKEKIIGLAKSDTLCYYIINDIGKRGGIMDNEKKKGLSLKTKLIIAVFFIGAMFFSYLTYGTLKLMSSGEWGKNASQNVNDLLLGEEGKVTTVTQAELEKVIRTAKLYTAEYPYNGYATVRGDNGKPKYYVAYEGIIRAGVNTDKITVDINEDERSIVIRLPYIEMADPIIDAGTLECIFTSSRYNVGANSSEAYNAAIVDLKTKALNDQNMREVAENSAKTAIKALVEPWVNNTNENNYTVTVLANGEDAPENTAKEGE